MSRFTPVLRLLADGLDLPQPARSRVLLEVAADLEDEYQAALVEGLSPAQAELRARQRFEPGSTALAELALLHTGMVRHFLDRLGMQAADRASRAALLLLPAMVIALAWGAIRASALIQQPTVWPALAAAVLALGLAAREAVHLWVLQDHDVRRSGRSVSRIFALAASSLLLTAGGGALEVYQTAGRVAAARTATVPVLVGGLQSSSSGMALALCTFLLSAIAWQLLSAKIACIQEAETSQLLSIDPWSGQRRHGGRDPGQSEPLCGPECKETEPCS